jgi:HK97 family phage major capsid protein
MEEARAKGYVKGDKKDPEVFNLLRRTVDPQTIYKYQELDQDDLIDIDEFNVVAWLKAEMRIMLNEEIARAILLGDGRLYNDKYKIKEDHIKPIATDDDLYAIKVTCKAGTDNDSDVAKAQTAKNAIRAMIKNRKNYKGSGNPTLFTTEEVLTSMLLIEDGIGHMMYRTEAELATALRVKNIVTVPVMEGVKLDSNANELMGIIVNLSDYNVGADKGGEINMFDDFDIDFNQQKYLIETRISGALIKPYSAIVLKKPVSQNP